MIIIRYFLSKNAKNVLLFTQIKKRFCRGGSASNVNLKITLKMFWLQQSLHCSRKRFSSLPFRVFLAEAGWNYPLFIKLWNATRCTLVLMSAIWGSWKTQFHSTMHPFCYAANLTTNVQLQMTLPLRNSVRGLLNNVIGYELVDHYEVK